jgi:uncharacterized protein
MALPAEERSVPGASREFQVFAKPAGPLCNLRCAYCYYLQKENLYPPAEPFRMGDDLLERYIVQHIEASGGGEICFSWHGGEPTILGLEYFYRIAGLQRKHTPAGRRVRNGMQTNGLLIDEEWCRFFAETDFAVGLSMDGPQEMHDRYRLTRGGRSTHRQAMKAFRLLQKHRIPCDILCAVHNHNVRNPAGVYRFFREIGAGSLGFLPVVEPRPAAETGVSPHTVPAGEYGEFLCAIFDEWKSRDAGTIAVQMFEEASRPARGIEHSLCVFRETCGDVPVVEHNGDFYCCDHFVDREHRLGNLGERPLVELLESPAQRAFGLAKRDSLPGCCRNCDELPYCNGGCPKDRFALSSDGEPGLNYLCPAFQRFFRHSRRHFERLYLLGGTPEESPVQRPPAPARGRNDPCPCGSGRKYKKCCLGRQVRAL